MPEISIPQLGCSEACPIGSTITDALKKKLEDLRTIFQEQVSIPDRQGDDFGEINIDEVVKDLEERNILSEAIGFRVLSSECDGLHCLLADYLAKAAPPRKDSPS